MTIDDFSLDLLSRLSLMRQELAEKKRPVIFICHSLGGLVFKQALISAKLQGNNYRNILESIHGVVFMGTPHRGSRSASHARLLSKIINAATLGRGVRSELLEFLKISSRSLEQISRQSVQILNPLSIVSFYEQKPLGPSLIVEPFSAILGLPNERAIPINADHREIARVSPRHKHRYMPVWKVIVELVESCLLEASSDTKELLDTLYCVDYKILQLRPRQPHKDTCDWILRHNVFQEWEQSSASTMLLISGPAGVGKSVLTRFVVEEVMAGSQNVPFSRDYVVASYFCSYNESASNSDGVVLRSILHQLVQINPQSQTLVKNRLQIRTRGGLVWSLTPKVLWECIYAVLSMDTMKRCMIALDAIEELPHRSALDILRGFLKIIIKINTQYPEHRLRIFVSSRHNAAYLTILKSIMHIKFTSFDTNISIEKYVRDSIDAYARDNEDFANSVGYAERQQILEKIVKQADGMFLWATTAWEDFRKGILWNRDVVKDKLEELDSTPAGINALYDRMVVQVKADVGKDMWLIFSILAVAARPLKEKELAILLALRKTRGQPEHSGEIDPFTNIGDIIEKNFPGLVVVHSDDSITFAHLSFKEFLSQYWSEKDPEWLRKAQVGITQAVIMYLNLRDLVSDSRAASSSESKSITPASIRISTHVASVSFSTTARSLHRLTFNVAVSTQYPLLEYAGAFYVDHLGVIPHEHRLWLDYADMGSAESILPVPWFSHSARGRVFDGRIFDESLMYPTSPLGTVISRFNSTELVRRFADHGYDLDDVWQTDGSWKRALLYCCRRAGVPHMKDLAILLLELGASPNDPDGSVSATTLQKAVEAGAWDLYEVLMKHPQIDLDRRNTQGRTVLFSLVHHASEEVFADFLNNNLFNINIQDSLGYTALHLATVIPKLEIMKQLLNAHGIRLDLVDYQGRTPLALATFWGYKVAALAIIAHSQAFPLPERGHLSSLVFSAKRGDKELLLELLEKHRYSNLSYHIDLSGKGVLHHAAMNDWADILTMCLIKGWEEGLINHIDHSGATALHYAASLGNTRSAEVLITHGANLRLQDRNGRTAAHAAADAGFKDTLMLLLTSPGTDVNQKDHQGRNLIHWAATIDSLEVIKTVLQMPGAEISRRDNMSLMPIDVAHRCQCPNAGRLLAKEMQSRDPGGSWTSLYPWKYPCTRPAEMETEKYWTIEDDTLLQRESRRRKMMNNVWEDLHRTYPPEQWALVVVKKMSHD